MISSYIFDIQTKIQRLRKVGLGYLSLNRQSMTLSGGEAQRMRLSAALDSSLTGIIYIMDEPTIGLHPKDTGGIIHILQSLRDLGNTVIVIEHDEDVMRAADCIIDIGPGAGKYGGHVIGQGTLVELKEQPSSITGQYLRKEKTALSPVRTTKGVQDIVIENAMKHNLQHISLRIPTHQLVVVTGVSGSGKSTLIFDVLAQANQSGSENLVLYTDQFQAIIAVDQKSLTRMKRSNVATYCGVYAEIRTLFASLPQTKALHLQAKDFSFNVAGGRCESCAGLGYIISNMLFFEDVEVICPVCGGMQFQAHILSVRFEGLNIADILHLSAEEATLTFRKHTRIHKILSLLCDVGLSYLTLGQILTTLSGGEGQRLKLAKELLLHESKQNLYLIDEPTTGLHPLDITHFLVLLQRLVDSGSSVIVVEHNTQVMQCADHMIDLGIGGGIYGGQVIAQGTPQELMMNPTSITGRYL